MSHIGGGVGGSSGGGGGGAVTVTGAVFDADSNLRVNPGALVSTSDSVTAVKPKASTPTESRPAAIGAANVTILAANSSRLGAVLVNEGPALCYVKFGATATTTSYTRQVPAGDYWEIPFDYTGIIDGICAAATPTAQFQVTELTA